MGEKSQLLSPVGDGQKGEERMPAVENCAIECGSAPSRSADREGKERGARRGGKNKTTFA